LASSVLNGVSSFAGQPWITDGLSSDAIHDVLLGIVLRGNSERPITARVQSQLDSVARLLRVDNLTVIQALYDLGQRLYISDPAPADYSLGDWTVAGGILGDRSFGGWRHRVWTWSTRDNLLETVQDIPDRLVHYPGHAAFGAVSFVG
jgi:hypothetical protein